MALLLAWLLWPPGGGKRGSEAERQGDGERQGEAERKADADAPAGTPILLPEGKRLTAEQTVRWSNKRAPFVWSKDRQRLLREEAKMRGFVEEGGKLVRRANGQTTILDPTNPNRIFYLAAFVKSSGRWGMFQSLASAPESWGQTTDAHWFSADGEGPADFLTGGFWEFEMSQARGRANSNKMILKGVREGGLEREPKEVARITGEIKVDEALAERAAKEILRNHNGVKLVESVANYCAENPNVGAVVILDLYTQERPVALKWFYDDGHGARESRRAPTPELERALREFVYQVQANLE